MASALEQSLEKAMVAALEVGDGVAFVTARNRRQAYWDYKAGLLYLETAKRLLTKMPVGSKAKAPEECVAWNGEVE